MDQSEHVSFQGAGSDQFTHGAQQTQRPGESETDPQTVGGRFENTVFRGECLGAVPLDLPFPGLTSVIVEELTGKRFDPALVGATAAPSWVVSSAHSVV